MWRVSPGRGDKRLGGLRLNHPRGKVVYLPLTEGRIGREYCMRGRQAGAVLGFSGGGWGGGFGTAPPREEDRGVGGGPVWHKTKCGGGKSLGPMSLPAGPRTIAESPRTK